jgi:hypothetical protein
MDARELEVRRVLDRYLVEVIEAYNLCPWARGARQSGELVIAILWGSPTVDEVCAAAAAALATPGMRVAMLSFPEAPLVARDLRAFRDAILARTPAGIADFHPDAELDLLTPARLVSFLRRSPDPMLQLVPLAILDAVRTPAFVPDLAQQTAMLDGTHPSTEDIGDKIAAVNHATVTRDAAAIIARLADIAADRAASYARVGISTSR